MPQTNQIELPNYGNPPVVETIVGVQFEPLANLTNAHLGAFWSTLDTDEWPLLQDAPVLPRQEERFGPEVQWGKSLRLQLTQDPSSRLQIRNRDGNRMLQVQNGRMHLNWLGGGENKYPRFPKVRREFEDRILDLNKFVTQKNIGTLVPDQWEVTYVNRIPQKLWQTPADWGFFKPLNGVPSIDGVIEAESFSGEWHFVIPGQRGRLHVNWQHAKDAEPDDVSHIRLTLTARGPVDITDDAHTAVMTGIDLGRTTIVQSFERLMSATANEEWKLKDAASS
jgi:uncharacterized protein (TIGR04255 family)